MQDAPATRANPPTATSLVDLLHSLETLKNLPRTGWRLRGIRDGESVADHAFRTAFAAMLLADALNERGYALDTERVMRMALLHEVAESCIGDIPYPALKHLSEETKAHAESDAAAFLLSPLNAVGERYIALWREFENRESPESRVVRVADKIEMLLQAWEYERAGARGLDAFWSNAWNTQDFDAFPLMQELLEDLRTRLNESRTKER